MKKHLLLFLAFSTGLAATAQIKKGAVLLGGQIYYSRATSTNAAFPRYQIGRSGGVSISAGKALKENAVWGLNLSYNPFSYFNAQGTSTGGVIYVPTKEKRYSAGVFYRKYKQLFKDVYFFTNGGLSYQGYYEKESLGAFPKPVYTESGGQLDLTPGVSYNLFRKVQVEVLIPSIFYVRYAHTSSQQNHFSIGTGLSNTPFGSLGVGFHFIL